MRDGPRTVIIAANMTNDIDPVAHNRSAWDRQVDLGNEWTQPVGPDVIARARSLPRPIG